MSPPGLAAPILSAPPTTLEHMFEATPFAVAMSPVVRVADPPGPRNDSAAKLAMVGVLTPGPVAMDLLTQVRIHRLDDVERTEYLVAWERAARWVEAQRMEAVVAVAGATATNRDDFAREHVKVALSGCGGSARADVDLARDMTGRRRWPAARSPTRTPGCCRPRPLSSTTPPSPRWRRRGQRSRSTAPGRASRRSRREPAPPRRRPAGRSAT